jgi:hypothetical protein
MTNDRYVRITLTVIATALVYLCIVLTPLPSVSAQGGRVVGAPTPGVSTGPAEMVVVGWRVPDTIPVTVARGDVRITNDTIRVNGRVQAEQPPGTAHRTVLIGWEEQGTLTKAGGFAPLGSAQPRGVPVSVRQPTP